MSNLTLEHIATDHSWSSRNERLLANELIALRESVNRVHSIVGLEIGGRLDALEGPAQRQRERDELATPETVSIGDVMHRLHHAERELRGLPLERAQASATIASLREQLKRSSRFLAAELTERTTERDEARKKEKMARADAIMFGANYDVMLKRVKEYEAERNAALAKVKRLTDSLWEIIESTSMARAHASAHLALEDAL